MGVAGMGAVRWWLAFSLVGSLGCASTPASAPHTAVPVPVSPLPVPLLLQGLKDGYHQVRAKAAWGLSGAGRASAEVVEALAAASRDPQREVRYAAVWALGHLEGPDAEAAVKALHD